MLEGDPVWVHTQLARDHALQGDGDVAQADGAVVAIQQRLADHPDRVGEVDDPGVSRGSSPGRLGQLEHQRDGTQGLGESAGPRRLLADGPEPGRQRLVHEPGRLAADAELDEHEIRTVECDIAVECRDQPPRPACAGEHTLRESADNL